VHEELTGVLGVAQTHHGGTVDLVQQCRLTVKFLGCRDEILLHRFDLAQHGPAVDSDGAGLPNTHRPNTVRHLGLPTDLPVARPARAPPLLDGLLDVAGEADTDVFESGP